MVQKAVIGAAIMLASSAGLFVSCGADGDSTTPTPTAAAPTTEVAVAMVDNDFVPSTIVVPVGVSISITAKNDGIAVHNMLVTVGETQFRSDLMVAPGASSTFEVTFPEPGDYDFVCGLHLPDMAGTITAR